MLNILQSLMKIPFIEPRILQEVKEALGERTMKDGFSIRKKTKSISYGVDTTVQSRKLMFELLPSIVDEEFDKLNCKEIYDDISGLERKKTGKIEHSETTHDDTLMAYLLVRYSLYYGHYLKNHGISAIPTPKNLRKSMTTEDMEKIQAIIDSANRNDSSDDFLENNSLIQSMEDQRRKIEAQENGFNQSNLDAFMNIVFSE